MDATGADCHLHLPICEMRALDFVQWDRYAGHPDDFVVFGWIAREDDKADFVVLRVVPEGIGFTTSSAERSREIGRVLNGGELSETHSSCRRVEHHRGADQLLNVVRSSRS